MTTHIELNTPTHRDDETPFDVCCWACHRRFRVDVSTGPKIGVPLEQTSSETRQILSTKQQNSVVLVALQSTASLAGESPILPESERTLTDSLASGPVVRPASWTIMGHFHTIRCMLTFAWNLPQEQFDLALIERYCLEVHGVDVRNIAPLPALFYTNHVDFGGELDDAAMDSILAVDSSVMRRWPTPHIPHAIMAQWIYSVYGTQEMFQIIGDSQKSQSTVVESGENITKED